MTIDHQALGQELYHALRSRTQVPPLTGRVPGLDLSHAYRVSEVLLALRQADGERVIGHKVGVTSPAVQAMLGVHQPDFGTLTHVMRYDGDMPISELLIQPRAEGEIAFTLGRDLAGPGVTAADVLAATSTIHTCFEVVDSRITDWNITIEDTVADNASSGLLAVGEGISPIGFDFENCRMVVTKNGAMLSEGFGRAALGSPLNSVAWLANTLGAFGVRLRAGSLILSGSLVPLEPVKAGDVMTASVEGLGRTEVRFT